MERKTAELCPDDYIYCAVPPNKRFPNVRGIPNEWYDQPGDKQLEFRKYINDVKCKECGKESGAPPYSEWMVTPVVCFDNNNTQFPEFQMTSHDVLMLWVEVISKGGCVSDGYLNLFS